MYIYIYIYIYIGLFNILYDNVLCYRKRKRLKRSGRSLLTRLWATPVPCETTTPRGFALLGTPGMNSRECLGDSRKAHSSEVVLGGQRDVSTDSVLSATYFRCRFGRFVKLFLNVPTSHSQFAASEGHFHRRVSRKHWPGRQTDSDRGRLTALHSLGCVSILKMPPRQPARLRAARCLSTLSRSPPLLVSSRCLPESADP